VCSRAFAVAVLLLAGPAHRLLPLANAKEPVGYEATRQVGVGDPWVVLVALLGEPDDRPSFVCARLQGGDRCGSYEVRHPQHRWFIVAANAEKVVGFEWRKDLPSSPEKIPAPARPAVAKRAPGVGQVVTLRGRLQARMTIPYGGGEAHQSLVLVTPKGEQYDVKADAKTKLHGPLSAGFVNANGTYRVKGTLLIDAIVAKEIHEE